MINQSSEVSAHAAARRRDLARESATFMEPPASDSSAFPVLRALIDRVLKAEQRPRVSEQRSRDTQTELARANRIALLGQLSASIVHEVNQPLSGMLINATTSLRMLAGDPPNAEAARETIRRAIRDARRASDVVKRLHSLFAKEDGPAELMDLNDATREVIALFQTDLRRTRIVVRSDFASDLPSVTANRIQIQQVILNLVRNALDAMSGCDDRPSWMLISTGMTDAGDIYLAVADSGPGIAPEDLERIFDAFYTTKPGGLGIGLSICRAIVEAHGGNLWARTGALGGALFKLALPRVVDRSDLMLKA
jgi:C4-dicarboxylate-specific signal transduction histidine kinase